MPAPNAAPLLADRDWLHRRYTVERTPVATIADEAGTDASNVYRALARHDIPRRHAHRALDDDRDEITSRVLAGDTITGIAADYDVDPAIVYDRCYAWGLRDVSELGASPAQLRHWYTGLGWPLRRVADKLGVTPRTARRRLMAAGVELRPVGRPRRQD